MQQSKSRCRFFHNKYRQQYMAEAAKSLQALKYIPKDIELLKCSYHSPLFHNIPKIRKAGIGCYNHDSIIFCMQSLPVGIIILPFRLMKQMSRCFLSFRSRSGMSVTFEFSDTKNSIASTLESYMW